MGSGVRYDTGVVAGSMWHFVCTEEVFGVASGHGVDGQRGQR